MSKKAPWSPLEAERRTYELAAELVGVERGGDARWLVLDAKHSAMSEERWREDFSFVRVVGGKPVFDAARVEREVRRIYALSDGRLVREVVWYIVKPNGTRLGWHDDHGAALASLGEWRCDAEAKGARLVRVTRIKRAS